MEYMASRISEYQEGSERARIQRLDEADFYRQLARNNRKNKKMRRHSK